MTPRDAGGASPRVASTLNVSVAPRDRRGGAVVLSGAIGGCARFEPSAGAKERRSPGELGLAREASGARPRPARRRAAPASDAAEADAGSASGANGGTRRREVLAALPSAPTAGVAGLPGLGVFLGELGSPAQVENATPASGRPPGLSLGRGLRSVPSLADVSVSIGGLPRVGMSRLAAPVRALIAKRSSRPAASAVPTAATAPSRTPRPSAEEPGVAPSPAAPDSASAVPAAAARGRIGRASRYIVNGILDVTIRRFRSPPRLG